MCHAVVNETMGLFAGMGDMIGLLVYHLHGIPFTWYKQTVSLTMLNGIGGYLCVILKSKFCGVKLVQAVLSQ